MIDFDRLFYNLLRDLYLIFLSFPTALPDTKKSIWSWRIFLRLFTLRYIDRAISPSLFALAVSLFFVNNSYFFAFVFYLLFD